MKRISIPLLCALAALSACGHAPNSVNNEAQVAATATPAAYLPIIPTGLQEEVDALRSQTRIMLRCRPTVAVSTGDRDETYFIRQGWQQPACSAAAATLHSAHRLAAYHAIFLELIAGAQAQGVPSSVALVAVSNQDLPEEYSARVAVPTDAINLQAAESELHRLCPLGWLWCTGIPTQETGPDGRATTEGDLFSGEVGAEYFEVVAQYLVALYGYHPEELRGTVRTFLDLPLEPIEMLSATTAGFRNVYTPTYLDRLVREHPGTLGPAIAELRAAAEANQSPGYQLARAYRDFDTDFLAATLCDPLTPQPLRRFLGGLHYEFESLANLIDPCIGGRECPNAPPRNCDE